MDCGWSRVLSILIQSHAMSSKTPCGLGSTAFLQYLDISALAKIAVDWIQSINMEGPSPKCFLCHKLGHRKAILQAVAKLDREPSCIEKEKTNDDNEQALRDNASGPSFMNWLWKMKSQYLWLAALLSWMKI
ncbi:hypothetical protein SUGI_0523300 [Cryptomeria japonica]|nr:hypothetical protein SUGI_0523300 [Cryptomeria japonica]